MEERVERMDRSKIKERYRQISVLDGSESAKRRERNESRKESYNNNDLTQANLTVFNSKP